MSKTRHCIIIPAADQGHSNALAAQIGVDPESDLNTFSVPLVPADGPDDAEPTHYAAYGQLDRWLAQLPGLAATVPDARWWQLGELDGLLLRSSLGDAEKHAGEPWNFERCLAAAGLKRRQTALFM